MQVLSALVSLTAVFGMGTGGPSLSLTPTIYVHRFLPTKLFFNGDPWENRTPVCGVRGRRLDRLTNGPLRLVSGKSAVYHTLSGGTPSGTRTLDTLIKSQVLYQLS